MTDFSPVDDIPSLILHSTLHSPTVNTRSWSSRPHPDPSTPLLATAASDKSVHIWDMRDWKLLSTISGGHKRSVRCVGWKDYGSHRKKRKPSKPTSSDGAQEDSTRDPVMLATGSFDANCGLWVWNREHHPHAERTVPGAFGNEDIEQDFTEDKNDEEDEEWHFSTLLTGPDSEIKDLKFSPVHYGANLLATCSRDKSVWVWEEVEPEEWETVAVLGEHTGDVKCLGWCEGATTSRQELRRRLRARRKVTEQEEDGEEEADMILGGRELLASGSYDDTIRLHHDDEAEGDWITIAVLTGHEGTVWDLKFESHVNLDAYPEDTNEEEVVVDWAPRLISCSDDMTVRVWRKQLSEKEMDEKNMKLAEARQGKAAGVNGGSSGGGSVPPIGFSTARLPSVIRPPTSTEKWFEEAKLPVVHVRSIYAVDWSEKTGLVVSCGGDGLIAVYQELVASQAAGSQDVAMNGTNEGLQPSQGEGGIKKSETEWKLVATMEAAHEEYEINHVCWAPIRDQRRQKEAGEMVDLDFDGFEEYIVSTGDDGQVRVWQLPKQVLDRVRQNA